MSIQTYKTHSKTQKTPEKRRKKVYSMSTNIIKTLLHQQQKSL